MAAEDLTAEIERLKAENERVRRRQSRVLACHHDTGDREEESQYGPEDTANSPAAVCQATGGSR